MQIPEGLRLPPASSGSSTGMIEQMWTFFVTSHSLQDMTPEELSMLKFTYFMAALQMYNTFIASMRAPDFVLQSMTEGMNLNINEYFTGVSQTLN